MLLELHRMSGEDECAISSKAWIGQSYMISSNVDGTSLRRVAGRTEIEIIDLDQSFSHSFKGQKCK